MVTAVLGYIGCFIVSINIMLVTSLYAGIVINAQHAPNNTDIISVKL